MAQRVARALPKLTGSHRRMADHVLAHPLQVATMPIDQVAARVGVSVATANRFARALGFEGYPQFRAALVLGFESALAPVEKLRDKLERPATVAQVFDASLAGSRRNIDLTRQSLDARGCEQAVDMVLAARRICVVGFGSASWLAGLLQRGLDQYVDNVQLLPSIEGPSYGARILPRLGTKDLLIAISFPRYFNDTVMLARRAREAGTPVLALTDRVASPLAPLASVALYASADSEYFASSDAGALMLIEALCSAVAVRAKDSLKATAQLAESIEPWRHDGAAVAADAAGATTRERAKRKARKAAP